MKNVFEQFSFTLESTLDGSPTLKLPDAGGIPGESMHHSGGAASETRYIYKDVIEVARAARPGLKTCVVGLGLAYIEMAWAAGASSGESLTSFEIVPALREQFVAWLNSEAPALYDQVALALDPEADIPALKRRLRANLEAFPLREDLESFAGGEKWNLICYDAYSRKTSEGLWSPEFLDQFIQKHCETDCVWTTYACTGPLKKVLRDNGFTVIKRPAFKGWRDSTLAYRGGFTKACWPNFFRTS